MARSRFRFPTTAALTSRRTARWLIALAAGWCAVAASSASRADPPDRAVQAHKQAAHKAFRLGRYQAAARHFKRAYALSDDPRLLYNIGLTHMHLGQVRQRRRDLVQARDFLRRFLALVPAGSGDTVAERRRLARVRRRARAHLEEIAGLLTRPPFSSRSRATPAASRPAPSHPRPDARTPADRRPERSSGPGVTSWVLYGVAAAAGIAGVTTGVLALDRAADSDELATRGDGPGANSAADAADRLALSTDIVFGVGAAALIGAVLTHLLLPRERAVRVSVTGSGLLFAATF